MLYTVFHNYYFEKNIWVGHYLFYQGDLTEINLKEDGRFKAVNKKRKQATIITVLKDLEFPIKDEIMDFLNKKRA